MSLITAVDTNILWWIQENMVSPFMNTAMPMITHLGDAGMVWILIGIALLITKKYRLAGVSLLLSLALCLFFGNTILKPLIARPRPCHTYPSIDLLIPIPHGYSFPSGHTLSSFAGAFSIYLYNKKAGISALILASLIAFSRLYLFVHYPSDIIAGTLLGILLAISAKKMTHLYFK